MAEILAVNDVQAETACWLILDCGHWFKWTGQRLKVGAAFKCPNCTPLKVIVPALADREPPRPAKEE